MDSRPRVGLSLAVEDDFRRAAEPLLDNGDVEILEWSFDMGWSAAGTAEWALQWIDQFAERERLLGHGVTFSPLSGRWTPRHEAWLQYLYLECRQRSYVHISEHFGFMSAGNFHQGAPLPVPLTENTLSLGRDRLKRLSEIAGMPVGLENLAFAFGPRDVREQGEFLDGLLRSTGGFLVLDLHNIYCQMCNFSIAADELLDSYPLDLVRELHVSGGSWSESSMVTAPIRRDTHDDAVPDEVFALVPLALERCPNVRAVIFERLGGTIVDDSEGNNSRSALQFQADYLRLRKIVETPR